MTETASDHDIPPKGFRQLFNGRNSVAWVVLLFTLLVQLIILEQLRNHTARAALTQFEYLVDKTREAITKRLMDHEQILFGAAGLFDTGQGAVSREQWRQYNERLQLAERYPGIQGVGFAQAVLPGQRQAHVDEVRAEGFPDYDIHPPGERTLYTPIVYLEPFVDRNLAAFGYDMFSEPVRSKAMATAAQTGQTQLTGKVTLRQETHGDLQAGILMYVPVYRPGVPLESPEQRMQALLGFVYSPYRVGDLMRGILGAADPELNLRIYAGPQESDELLIFASREQPQSGSPLYGKTLHMKLYGQSWTLRLESRPQFDAFFHSHDKLVIALGLGLSILLFFLTSSLSLRRSRAEALARQMTEHIRESRHALQLSEERLSLALKGSNDGFWDLNLEAGTFYASPRAWHMLGYRPGELSSDLKLWERVLKAEDVPEARARLARTLLSAVDHFTSELRFQHKDGHIVPMLVRGYIQRDRDGQALRLSGTGMDLTEHKRIEQMKDEFVSTVSHELRTPLTSISGALGLITGGALGPIPPKMQQMLEIAHRNSLRLGHLINDLLDMEKMAAGKMSFDMREHALPGLLEEALASNQAFAAHLGVNCVLRTPPPAHVWVDALRLQQVLGNFMSNAIKYTPEGGSVTLHCSIHEDRVRISVSDQGPGISEDFKSRIFEKFAQADASDSRQKGGSGLGLAIAKEFIERMGGSIGFDSSPDKGTTFWCELQIIEAPSVSANERNNLRLLVVEDEPDTGRLLLMMLHDGGYTVDRVQSLHAARERLASNHYDAMTLDLHLPDGSGRDLIDELRNDPATATMPIIVISADSHSDQREKDEGISWLHKPISTAQLLIALGNALGEHTADPATSDTLAPKP